MSGTDQEMWCEWPAHVMRRLASSAREQSFARGDWVYRVGEHPRGLYVVQSGLVGLTIIGLSGKEHLLRFFRAGQFFGHRSLFASENYHGNTVVLEPTRLTFIAREPILDLLKREPELYQPIVCTLAQELRRAETQHVMILENQILSRAAQALVYLKELHADHDWTRSEVANFCASTTPTIIKAFAELERRGLIRQSGRKIEILDRDGLIHLQE